MNDLDMSRPGAELFPEAQNQQFNSYQDVMTDPNVGDPLNTGVTPDAADLGMSDKEYNFQALRDETAKLQSEREYWKGRAEALSSQNLRPEPTNSAQSDAYSALDWNEPSDVQKAFHTIRQENQSLRQEIKDSLAAMESKSQHQDWNNMVTQHVPKLTSKNPIFAEMIQKVSNPYEAAYLLAELNARASSQTVPQPSPPYQQNYGNGQRAIENAQKPRSLATVGGGSSLNGADYYASMSDEDFMKIAARNLANI